MNRLIQFQFALVIAALLLLLIVALFPVRPVPVKLVFDEVAQTIESVQSEEDNVVRRGELERRANVAANRRQARPADPPQEPAEVHSPADVEAPAAPRGRDAAGAPPTRETRFTRDAVDEQQAAELRRRLGLPVDSPPAPRAETVYR